MYPNKTIIKKQYSIVHKHWFIKKKTFLIMDVEDLTLICNIKPFVFKYDKIIYVLIKNALLYQK